MRDLTRMRAKVVHDRVRMVNRLHAVLEDANVKLTSVVSDLLGVSARHMLTELIRGHSIQPLWPTWRRARSARKRDQLELALDGDFGKHHAFLARRLLIQERALSAQQRALEQQIQRRLSADQNAVLDLWCTIPGVGRNIAVVMVAELGIAGLSVDIIESWLGDAP